MAEESEHIPVSIPAKFIPFYAEPVAAPEWSDGSTHYYTFDSQANTIDEDGNIIPQEELCNYGHERRRFYVAYGSRGSGKSDNLVLIAILQWAMKKPHVILCVRETFSSIRDSMYATIKDWIVKLGLTDSFDFIESEIRCKLTGARFICRGLKVNSSEIKSLKNVGLVIADEALMISQSSWSFLIPTIRLPNSEIWIAFNTGTPEDFTYRRFVTDADERSYVFKINLLDNKLAPQILLDEMEASRKLAEKTGDYNEFNNVWLGDTINAISGNVFKPEQIKVIAVAPVCSRVVRGYDLASSAVSAKNPDPDFTASVKLGVTSEGMFCILDVFRIRDTADVIERIIVNTASQDGSHVPVSIAQDPGQSGKAQAQYLTRKLSGYTVHTSPESGSKQTRAGPVSSQINVGNFCMVAGDWNQAFINELRSFNGEGKNHDDQCDALARAFSYLQTPYIAQMVSIRGL